MKKLIRSLDRTEKMVDRYCLSSLYNADRNRIPKVARALKDAEKDVTAFIQKYNSFRGFSRVETQIIDMWEFIDRTRSYVDSMKQSEGVAA
ncbi:MAG: hypothetical protein KJ718_03660 [Nanoarchaeota archaeon]|nr:hypothetical protein [Nanoarchaeota archaeon]MBU1051627.1 hypothetical protein [Nanoarchaeota archaeon]MBU1988829.1 hypothetical protein [Nanoarchaeota archaeon]